MQYKFKVYHSMREGDNAIVTIEAESCVDAGLQVRTLYQSAVRIEQQTIYTMFGQLLTSPYIWLVVAVGTLYHYLYGA